MGLVPTPRWYVACTGMGVRGARERCRSRVGMRVSAASRDETTATLLLRCVPPLSPSLFSTPLPPPEPPSPPNSLPLLPLQPLPELIHGVRWPVVEPDGLGASHQRRFHPHPADSVAPGRRPLARPPNPLHGPHSPRQCTPIVDRIPLVRLLHPGSFTHPLNSPFFSLQQTHTFSTKTLQKKWPPFLLLPALASLTGPAMASSPSRFLVSCIGGYGSGSRAEEAKKWEGPQRIEAVEAEAGRCWRFPSIHHHFFTPTHPRPESVTSCPPSLRMARAWACLSLSLLGPPRLSSSSFPSFPKQASRSSCPWAARPSAPSPWGTPWSTRSRAA